MSDPRKQWTSSTIAIIDVETSGLDWTLNVVIEVAIGLLNLATREFTPAYSSLINTGVQIAQEITDLTGITQVMVDAAPPPCGVWPNVAEVLDKAEHCCAYNAAFDHHFLARAGLDHEHMRTTQLRPRWLDPLPWVRWVDPYAKGKGRHTLGVTAQRWGLPVSQAHRAAGDVETTAGIVLSLIDRTSEPILPNEWDEMLLTQTAAASTHDADFAQYFLRQFQAKRSEST